MSAWALYLAGNVQHTAATTTPAERSPRIAAERQRRRSAWKKLAPEDSGGMCDRDAPLPGMRSGRGGREADVPRSADTRAVGGGEEALLGSLEVMDSSPNCWLHGRL